MNITGFLPAPRYKIVAASVPILCVDGVLTAPEPGACKFLLVKRRLPPFKDEWWPPGGRVFKGETLAQAFRRIMFTEVGVRLLFFGLIGFYELRYEEADADAPGGRHTVSAVFQTTVPATARIRLDEQSSAWKWADRLPAKFRIQEV